MREKIEQAVLEHLEGYTFHQVVGQGRLFDIKQYAKETADSILALVREAVPELKKAHTYASENADYYMGVDAGFKMAVEEMLRRIK